MKIAFAGKGGSGKTTLASLFVRHLAAQELPVVAVDADINQHLAEALGADQPPAMGAHLTEIKEYLRGTNPRISSAAAMAKTTPPGRGSRLLRHGGPDPVHDLAGVTPCGARLLATGPFDEDDLGVACHHAKAGAVELYLNHLADRPGEYVVVDYSAGYGTALALVGNKVQGPEDVSFLRGHAAGDLLAWFGYEPAVRAMEQGRPLGLDDLSHATMAALTAVQDRLDAQPKDWDRYTRQAPEFHRRNARAWASTAAGEDLTGQIDPEFTLGSHALAMTEA